MLKEYIKIFCNNNSETYSFYDNYSCRFMYGKQCLGFIVKQGTNVFQAIMEFTHFLDEKDYDDVDLECEGVAYDNMGLDMIVYFPNAKNN